MQKGIDYASCVVVFITERYIDKVGGKGDSGEMDNCRFEFNHIAGSKPPSRIIAVVMEPRCRNQKEWYGMVKSTLQSQLYIDWSSDDEGRAESAAAEVMKMFRMQVPMAVSERMAALFPSGLAPVRSGDDSINRAGHDAVFVSKDKDMPPRLSVTAPLPLKAVRLDLKDLNQRQAEILVSTILGEDVKAHFGHPVSGAILASIDSAEEVQALFRPDFVLGPLRAKAVFNSVADYKTGGIDDAFLQKCKLHEGMHTCMHTCMHMHVSMYASVI
jgi:predicted nuclease of predicted toxin-antitoxin system